MKIYLDNCCLNRPFDDQSRLRTHLEAEAIKTILTLVEQGQWDLVSSQVLAFEISKIPDEYRKKELNLINMLANDVIQVNADLAKRANEFERHCLQAFDALHLACAEDNADIFLTVDDKFLNKASKIKNLRINISSPLVWLNEVLL